MTRAVPFFGLSCAAGCVDAISFLGFGGVFTANMTGNTVLLGIAVASHLALVPSSLGIVPPLLAVATFVVGAAIALPAFRERFDARRAATVVLAEVIVLIAAGIGTAIVGHIPLIEHGLDMCGASCSSGTLWISPSFLWREAQTHLYAIAQRGLYQHPPSEGSIGHLAIVGDFG